MSEILVDEKSGVMDRATLDSLLEYSCSLPTGTTTGKRWKRNANAYRRSEEPEWWMGEYGEPSGDEVPITWRRILVV